MILDTILSADSLFNQDCDLLNGIAERRYTHKLIERLTDEAGDTFKTFNVLSGGEITLEGQLSSKAATAIADDLLATGVSKLTFKDAGGCGASFVFVFGNHEGDVIADYGISDSLADSRFGKFVSTNLIEEMAKIDAGLYLEYATVKRPTEDQADLWHYNDDCLKGIYSPELVTFCELRPYMAQSMREMIYQFDVDVAQLDEFITQVSSADWAASNVSNIIRYAARLPSDVFYKASEKIDQEFFNFVGQLRSDVVEFLDNDFSRFEHPQFAQLSNIVTNNVLLASKQLLSDVTHLKEMGYEFDPEKLRGDLFHCSMSP